MNSIQVNEHVSKSASHTTAQVEKVYEEWPPKAILKFSTQNYQDRKLYFFPFWGSIVRGVE